MAHIKSIETTYNNHRFRSRLEARWAYAFDLAGIRWQYEPEGLVCERRLSAWVEPAVTFPYLPDFFLPDLGVWAEVKGRFPDQQELTDLLDAAAHLGGLVLLGPLANPFGIPWHLYFHKGDLLVTPWAACNKSIVAWHRSEEIGANDCGEVPDLADVERFLLDGAGVELATLPAQHVLRLAMMTAARARFEHGETPARP
jgi:hypothetical protein